MAEINTTSSNAPIIKRKKDGTFAPGVSGNPGGRFKIDPEVKAILKGKCPDCARRLVEFVDDPNKQLAMLAITEIFNRIYGKPSQMQELEISGGLDIRSQIRDVLLQQQANIKDNGTGRNTGNTEE